MGDKIVKMKPKKLKSKSNITFAMCGLDVEMNSLQAPICDCGCDEYMSLILKDDELADAAAQLIASDECDHSGIFTIDSENNVTFLIQNGVDENGKANILCFESFEPVVDYKDIGEMYDSLSKELEIHKYGLMHCTENGKCQIIMD